ncbi:DUF4249 family protein [Membranihabitans marinus]|uniref:DUF4249 family protein n=1 Tax=Membranihabitans marinus TaxID=1227546 RepID=UPI001F26E857|nr:DUF4249 family protein [Membranihabitans marinus]
MKSILTIIVQPIWVFAFLFFSNVACEKNENLSSSQKSPVLAAYLFADQGIDSIYIGRSIAYDDADSVNHYLDNLEVLLSDGENEYQLNSIGEGYYQNLDLTIQSERDYKLSFYYNGEVVSAETYIPAKKEVGISAEEIELEKIEAGFFGGGGPGGGFGGGFNGDETDPIELTWDNSEADHYYVVIKNIEEEIEYINENIALFDDENGGRRRFSFITEPEIMDVYRIDPRIELTQYGTYEIIVYRVNPEYVTLYENSSNSTLYLEKPATNVVNGLGILTGVNSDTLYLEVVEP